MLTARSVRPDISVAATGELALIEAIRSGAMDKVLISGIDRVGRSLTDLINFMEVCRTTGVAASKGMRQVARLAGISAASVSRLKNAFCACLNMLSPTVVGRLPASRRIAKVRTGRPMPITRRMW
jgi:hypothetical protein